MTSRPNAPRFVGATMIAGFWGKEFPMLIASALRAAALLVCVALIGPSVAGAQTPTSLFDGKSLSGWSAVGDANWSVTNGELVATSGSGFLVTARPYGNYQLTLEFWSDEEANSGVFIRCANPKEITDKNCYEVNIFDKRPDQTYRTGGIVNIASPASQMNAAGRWNSFDITARGAHLTVVLNGVKMVDIENAALPSGAIALQRSAGTIKFRNVRLREFQ